MFFLSAPKASLLYIDFLLYLAQSAARHLLVINRRFGLFFFFEAMTMWERIDRDLVRLRLKLT